MGMTGGGLHRPVTFCLLLHVYLSSVFLFNRVVEKNGYDFVFFFERQYLHFTGNFLLYSPRPDTILCGPGDLT